jgi:UDPglucose 6-dehydrogenase
MNVGIVGFGFVGSAIYEGLKDFHNVEVYDIDPNKFSTFSSIDDLVNNVESIFICVPTPMKSTGECDVSIVEGVASQINDIGKKLLIIIKSTIPPGSTANMSKKFKNLDIVFNPEFLTEKNALNDFKEQARIICGGDEISSRKVKEIYKKCEHFKDTKFLRVDSAVAEMIKYSSNCFLATKVIFFNEIKEMCDHLKIGLDDVVDCLTLDDRIAGTHCRVPGPDEKLGFGGTCFPKDINSLIYEFKRNGLNPSLLEAVWQKNLEVRPEKDWEYLIGRAVTKEKK